jgi:hypothetical protein
LDFVFALFEVLFALWHVLWMLLEGLVEFWVLAVMAGLSFFATSYGSLPMSNNLR